MVEAGIGSAGSATMAAPGSSKAHQAEIELGAAGKPVLEYRGAVLSEASSGGGSEERPMWLRVAMVEAMGATRSGEAQAHPR